MPFVVLPEATSLGAGATPCTLARLWRLFHRKSVTTRPGTVADTVEVSFQPDPGGFTLVELPGRDGDVGLLRGEYLLALALVAAVHLLDAGLATIAGEGMAAEAPQEVGGSLRSMRASIAGL